MPHSDAPALPRIGYGAANLGNLFRAMSDDEAWEILDAAWESGIRYFDTAPHYGLGLSERRLGAFLRTKPRDEYVVSTKVGRLLRADPGFSGTAGVDGGLDLSADFHVPATERRVWDFSEAGIRSSLAESLDRMGLDHIDVLFLHDPERHDVDLALREALPALERLRDEGAVRAVGIGSMDVDALAASVEGARLDLVMIAGRYTLLEQPAASEVLPACRLHGTGVVAASVFNSGLLANDDPRRSDRYEYGQLPEPLWNRLQAIVAVCRAHHVPLSAAAVQFPFRDSACRSVVLGASRAEHLHRNVELMEVEIPAEFWEDLSQARLIA